MKSEKISVAAPLSYAGSAERIWRMSQNPWVRFTILLSLIAVAWLCVSLWYVVMYFFFGVLFIPYRLVRRGQRKRKLENMRHRELMGAMAGR